MEMSLFRLVFYGIPEYIALVALAFAIAKEKFDWKRIILLGLFLACTAYAIRLIPITFGVHTIFGIGLLIFFLNYLVQVDLTRSITSVLLTYIILTVAETVSRTVTLKLLHLSIDEVMRSEFLITVTGLPEVILLFLTAFIIKKTYLKDVE